MAEINNEKPIRIPNKDGKLAELTGIILGDGGIYTNKEKSMYELRIAGHSTDDKEYLLNFVKPLIEELFDINVRVYFSKKRNFMHIIAQSKRLIDYLEKMGLKSGDKIRNNLSIPSWIFSDEKYIKSCIRGLIDTDGSVYNIKNRNYSYISFTCGIPSLREDFEALMKGLGYKLAKWNYHRTPETYIASKELILRYSKEIGFSNPKHIKRLKVPMISNAPVV